MELEVVGRCLGSPLGAACSGYVVWSPGAVVLLDCGPGILERLWARGILPRLDAVVNRTHIRTTASISCRCRTR